MLLKLLLSDEIRISCQTYIRIRLRKRKKKKEHLFNLIHTCKTLCTRTGIKVCTSSSNPIKVAIKAKLTQGLG